MLIGYGGLEPHLIQYTGRVKANCIIHRYYRTSYLCMSILGAEKTGLSGLPEKHLLPTRMSLDGLSLLDAKEVYAVNQKALQRKGE